MARPSVGHVVRTFALWLGLSAVVTGLLSLAPLFDNGFGKGFWNDLLGVGLLSLIGGFCGAGLVCLVVMARSMRALHLPSNQMRPTEAVMKETHATHYRTFWPLPMRLTVGGKLYLTTSKLVFKRHAGQPGPKEMAVPLAEIVGARRSRHSLLQLPNGLLIERADGKQDLFTCGMECPIDEWVSAIMVLRGMGPAIECRVDHGDTTPTSLKAEGSTDIQAEGPGEFVERPAG